MRVRDQRAYWAVEVDEMQFSEKIKQFFAIFTGTIDVDDICEFAGGVADASCSTGYESSDLENFENGLELGKKAGLHEVFWFDIITDEETGDSNMYFFIGDYEKDIVNELGLKAKDWLDTTLLDDGYLLEDNIRIELKKKISNFV